MIIVTNDRNLTSLLETYISQLGTSTDSAFSAIAFAYMALEEECKYGQSRTLSGIPIVSDGIRDRIVKYSENDTLVDRMQEARNHLINKDPLMVNLIERFVRNVKGDNIVFSAVSFFYMALLKAKSIENANPNPTKSPMQNEI